MGKHVRRPQEPMPAAAPSRSRRHAPWIAVGAILAFVVVARLAVAEVPIERDEGEYAYAGQLILQGVPPYRAAYNMKFPGTYYAYSVILLLFGQTAEGIHRGLLLVNAATILLVFVAGRRLVGGPAGVTAAAVYALLSMAPRTLGLFAHATHFVVLPLVAGLCVLARPPSGRRWPALWAGVLFGLAVLMKQHAVLFVPFAAGFVAWRDWRSDQELTARASGAALVLAGAVIPFAILSGVLAAQGVFGAFWFWTIDYARAYVSEVPLAEAPALLAGAWTFVTEGTLALWLLGALGLGLLWGAGWPTETRVLLTGLLGASLLAICPGFYFRAHYFILLLPATALLAGVAVVSVERLAHRLCPAALARSAAAGLLVASAAICIASQYHLFLLPAGDLSRALYGTATFVNAPVVARHLQRSTSPADTIAVLGSEPEIYFHADRRSATGYVYTYALMEPQPHAPRMQDEMIRQIEAAHPKYLVAVLDRTSWLPRPSSDQRIFTWIERYTTACYDREAVPGLAPDAPADAAAPYGASGLPDLQNELWVYRRRSDAPCSTR